MSISSLIFLATSVVAVFIVADLADAFNEAAMVSPNKIKSPISIFHFHGVSLPCIPTMDLHSPLPLALRLTSAHRGHSTPLHTTTRPQVAELLQLQTFQDPRHRHHHRWLCSWPTTSGFHLLPSGVKLLQQTTSSEMSSNTL